MSQKLSIFFYMTDIVGPHNACIGFGQVLLKRGHRVCFMVDDRFKNKFTKYGFEEYLLTNNNNRDESLDEKAMLKIFTQSIEDAGLFLSVSPLEKIKSIAKTSFLDDQYNRAKCFQPQIKKIIETEKPDILVVDSELMPPCLMHSGIPWVFLFCSNPTGIFDSDRLPPFGSDFPVDSDPQTWQEHKKALQEFFFDELLKRQKNLALEFGYPVNEKQKFISHSNDLNIYQFPEELDYHDVIDIPKTFVRVDAFCREESGTFELPELFRNQMKSTDKLIYFSMGSMGSFDVKLMKKIIATLAKTSHFYIVSKGMLHEQFTLADNMWGDAFLPQTLILPLVDLVITHGGNNSLTEAIYYGKPTIVMPLFYDQFNNAQRVHEKGFGIRLDPYEHTEQELLESIECILNNSALQVKMKKASQRIRSSESKLKACIELEKVAQKYQK